MTDNLSQLPQPGVILNLDTERRDETRDPFVVVIGGRQITFIDPDDIDWRDMASIRIPADLIRVILSPEDRRHVETTPMPRWKFNKLMEGYNKHFGIEEQMQELQRQMQFHGQG